MSVDTLPPIESSLPNCQVMMSAMAIGVREMGRPGGAQGKELGRKMMILVKKVRAAAGSSSGSSSGMAAAA
jgi:hypothetical protein